MTSALACPRCSRTDTVYEDVSVPGWRALDGPEREVDWDKAVAVEGVGCSCGWEGGRAELVVLGTDGEPLVEVHPDQTSLLEA